MMTLREKLELKEKIDRLLPTGGRIPASAVRELLHDLLDHIHSDGDRQ